MFFEPDYTQFDLNFRVCGIHVRVHPLFWLISAALGWSALNEGFAYLIMWIFCVFVSILLHEMGHVLMGRLFGSDGHIVLYSFGGLAVGSSSVARRWQRVLVLLAGPFAQFLLLGCTILLVFFALPAVGVRSYSDLAWSAIRDLLMINIFWPILNLLPIWPLDGGRIFRELFEWVMPGRGARVALGISIVVAALLAVNSLIAANGGKSFIPYFPGGVYSAIFYGLFALTSYQQLQAEAQFRRPWDEERDEG